MATRVLWIAKYTNESDNVHGQGLFERVAAENKVGAAREFGGHKLKIHTHGLPANVELLCVVG